MKRINKLLKEVTIISLATSFVSFGITIIGGLISSSTLILFWYLGLAGIWAILMASVVASAAFLLHRSGTWFAQYVYRLKGYKHHAPLTATY